MEIVTLHAEGEIAWLTMNRPEALNAFDQPMVDAMMARLKDLAADRRVRAAILTGKGRSFSTGVDLTALTSGKIKVGWFRDFQRLIEALEQIEIPLVIGARGDCLGGGLMLLLAGDYRIAGDDLRAALGSVQHGIVPGSAPFQLPLAIGMLGARRLCLFGETIDASEALRIGLVDRVVPASRVEQVAHAAAERVAKFPRAAVRETKRLLVQAASFNLSRFARDYLEAQQRCFDSGAATDLKGNRRA